eukprot:1146986-Pelagomonas_calceolata.AAC.7
MSRNCSKTSLHRHGSLQTRKQAKLATTTWEGEKRQHPGSPPQSPKLGMYTPSQQFLMSTTADGLYSLYGVRSRCTWCCMSIIHYHTPLCGGLNE